MKGRGDKQSNGRKGRVEQVNDKRWELEKKKRQHVGREEK